MFVNKMIIYRHYNWSYSYDYNFSLTTDSELAGQSELIETEFVDKEVEKQ
jgi:hypothetical protein